MKKSMTKMAVAGTVMAACFLAVSASAQGPANRQRLRENVNTLRLLRMTQALNLTEEQAARIFPLANRLEREKQEINARIGLEMKGLGDLLKAENPKDEELLVRCAAIRDLRKQVRNKDEEFESFLEGEITPGQRARYLLFTVEFYRGMGEQLDRARALYNRILNRQKRNPE